MNTMKAIKTAAILSLLLFTAGCATFQANTELLRGRTALLRGMPLDAIPHLEQATTLDGTIKYSTLLESGWTYLGRAYYEAKKYSQARQALERALAANKDDGFARLYLGLTLARQDDHDASRKEALLGLKALNDALEFIVYNTADGVYWDPSGNLRKELSSAQRDVSAANPSLGHLLERLEALGAAVEEEIDLARLDERRDRDHSGNSDM
jgi:tetratricopeptide (TPR) repeat protein